MAKLDCFCFDAHLTLTGSALLAHKFPFLVADALSLFSAARIRWCGEISVKEGGVQGVEPSPLRLLSVGCRRLSFHLDGTRVLNRIIMSLVARISLNCKLFSLSSRVFSGARSLSRFLFSRALLWVFTLISYETASLCFAKYYASSF